MHADEGAAVDNGRRICDVLVIGSGAAGLAAAVTAATHGARVLVVDAAGQIGGTTAISGGWLYVPGTRRGLETTDDSHEDIETYLTALGGEHLDAKRLHAYLDSVPEAIDFFEEHTDVEFVYPDVAPDYEMDRPGARADGRCVYAAPIDGRRMGGSRLRLRPYLKEITVFGVMPQIGPDLQRFLNANRSLSSFAYVLRRILRNWTERLRYRRGLDLSNGNALVARLVLTADKLGIPIMTRARATQLVQRDGGVAGALLETGEGRVTVEATRGVVLACGGFSHDPELRARLFPHTAPDGSGHVSPVTEEHTGEGLRLAQIVGARLDDDVDQPAAWAPVTAFRGRDRTRVFPHLRGVGLPGIIAVTREGERFTNESDSYHAFGQAMLAANAGHEEVYAYLLADARTMHRYGIGYAKPFPMPRLRYRLNGYLYVGRTLRKLAERAGIDPDRLVATVREFNRHARSGEDPVFGRGASEFNWFKGDMSHSPNPSLNTVEFGPFYATRIRMGDLGTFAGLATDPDGAVIGARDETVDGLYAAGAAASSVFAGAYPGHGANLGPAMVQGYRIGRVLGSG